MDGLGNAKSSTGQQCEEGAISLSAQRPVSRLSGQPNDPADLCVRKNVRDRSRPALFPKDSGRYLMTLILSLKIQSKPSNIGQPVGALVYRTRLSCPLDRDFGLQVPLPLAIGICGEALEVKSNLF